MTRDLIDLYKVDTENNKKVLKLQTYAFKMLSNNNNRSNSV